MPPIPNPLEPIVKALLAIAIGVNQATLPSWAVAILGSLVGGLIGAFGASFAQFFAHRLRVAHEKEVLRKMLYADLGHAFMAVIRITSEDAPKTGLDPRPERLGQIQLKGREHANTKPDLYVQLDDYHVLERHFTRVSSLASISNFLGDFSMAELFLKRFVFDIRTDQLNRDFLLKSLGPSKSSFLEDLEKVKAMKASTMMLAREMVEPLFPPEDGGTKGE